MKPNTLELGCAPLEPKLNVGALKSELLPLVGLVLPNDPVDGNSGPVVGACTLLVDEPNNDGAAGFGVEVLDPKLKLDVGLFDTNPNPELGAGAVPELKAVLLLGAPKANVPLGTTPWSFWVLPKENGAAGVPRLEVLLLALEPKANNAGLETDLGADLF